MSVTRIMGIETEYGITTPGRSTMNAMVASSDVVTAFGRHGLPSGRRMASWDYDRENPLRDARGYDMSISEAVPTQLTNEDLGLANVILTNGGRLYVDHAHPEYSTPEVTNPRDAVLWDRSGVEVMRRAMGWVAATPGSNPVVLYKNNTDNKGVSYGCHENYLVRRATPFASLVRHLIPFFITRQVFTGTGRVGLGQDGRSPGFQLSQRADFFEVDVGLETTLKRPIINTRDEPHADPEKWRRLHVIVGDANLSDTATYLKVGSTAIMLSMIEDGWLDPIDWLPLHPVPEMHAVSHDPSLTHRLELPGGRRLTAVDVQFEMLEKAQAYCARRSEDPDPKQTRHVLGVWQRVLESLARDPAVLAREIDWVAKLRLMNAYIARDNLTWESPTLTAIDLQYSDIRPDKGLAARLELTGHLVRMTTDEEVSAAVIEPPPDTRAYFRGECIRRFPEAVSAASWDSIVLDLPERDSLVRVPTVDPYRGTRDHVGELLSRSPDVSSLVRALEQAG
jgi:proteasome accessory factor PafA2